MLSSYRVACPHAGCDWTGSLVPSVVQGGEGRESAPMQRAWLGCPRCQGDWEVRIEDDKVTVVPATADGGGERGGAVVNSNTSSPVTVLMA